MCIYMYVYTCIYVYVYIHIYIHTIIPCHTVQFVPENMRCKIFIGMEIGILQDDRMSLFKRLTSKETSTLTILDSILNSGDHFESHLCGTGLESSRIHFVRLESS